MPAELNLIEDGYVLHYVFREPWSMTDMVDVNRRAKEYYDAAGHKLHVLLDVRGIRSAPPGFIRARSNPDITHPNAGNIAVVGANSYIRALGDVILKLARFQRAKFFGTEEEAWDYLREEMVKQGVPQRSKST